MSREWYTFGDKCYEVMVRKFKRIFTRYRLMLRFDELNVMGMRKASASLYSELDTICRKYFTLVAKRAYTEAKRELEHSSDDKETDDIIDDAWISKQLSGYNPVTKYVYEHEVERKRARFMESVLADHEAGSRRAVANDFTTAENLWKRQTNFHLITIEDAAVLQGYKKMGVRHAKWVTQRDEQVCKECKPRDGVIYPIDGIPTKHPGCRCYLIPILDDSRNSRKS